MPATPASLLREARLQLDGREADWLLMHVTGASSAQLQINTDRPVDAQTLAAFHALVDQRRMGTPLAYLLGTQPFRSLELAVDDRVLIPRPETEELVERALALAPAHAPVQALDLGTGSGAIALAMASERPAWTVSAAEASDAALAVARANGERLGLTVHWHLGDWFRPLKTRTFDLIVSNPPYVSAQDPDLATDVAAHEPGEALIAGVDGLDALRTIAHTAPTHLNAAGWLIVEHGYRQGLAVRDLMASAGFASVHTSRDSQGQDRITEGQMPETHDG